MLSERERERYRRQILLFGDEGQERLKQAHIFIAGAGGLGSPVALYLAVAGVGTITIVDMDTVDLSNLNRQILHWGKDVGRLKTASVAEKLSALNPVVRVEEITGRIDEENIDSVAADCDLIVDAMDNFPTRYLLNRTALRKGVPFIHGAVRGLQGQATTVIPGKTPCLRCLFPQSPPPSAVFPIIGATCGVIGSIEATEAVKLLTGQGEPLAGRLLIWDGLAACVDTLVIERNPGCPDCGPLGRATK